MFKNIASQQVAVYAWDTAAGAPATGDAGNITASISLDGGADAPTNDVNPTEIDAVTHQGVYVFDLLQAETDGDLFTLWASSTTADVVLDPVYIYTDQMTPAVIALIDAAISSRAPSATALSTATWTALRAAALDNLDVASSTLATNAQAVALLAAIAGLNDLSDVEVWTYVTRTLTDYPGLLGLLTHAICSHVCSTTWVTTEQVNLFIEAGTTRIVTGSVLAADSSPVDLTGAQLVWRTSTGLEKTSVGGDITILAPATGGAYTFTISAAETTALVPQGPTAAAVTHQLKVKLAGGAVYSVFEGKIRIDDTLVPAW